MGYRPRVGQKGLDMADWLQGSGFGGGPNPQQAAIMQMIADRPLSEQLSLRKRVCRLETLERLRAAGKTPNLPLEFTSQYGEDCYLFELFDGKLDGFYIEVGAYDGYRYSVTYPFEAMGWTGLLVEPIPDRFERARTRRPGSRVVNAALAGPGSTGTCTFNVVDGNDIAMLSYLAPNAANMRDIRQSGAVTKSVTVPLSTMDAMLAEHQGPIDVAVLDVEGGEIELLKGFDLLKHKPRVLMIEEGIPAPTSPTMQYLAKFPYTPVGYMWINRVYIHKDEKELIRRSYDLPL